MRERDARQPRPALTVDGDIVDVAVVGGGPAGLAAALWAARYRRRVVLVEGGLHRNDWTDAAYGYLGLDGMSPAAVLAQARADVTKYPEVDIVADTRVDDVVRADTGEFDLRLDPIGRLRALRLVLATGVRDVFPAIERFEDFYGTSVFTCPSCDGYQAQGKSVAVVGEHEDLAEFGLGLLDWARSVVVIRPGGAGGAADDALGAAGVSVVEGEPVAFDGGDGQIRAIELGAGGPVACDMVFCKIPQVQHSDLAERLGCAMSAEGSVVVDDHCRTSVDHVFAAGDMTPGPHLVQVAAAKGAIAGITAATSLRGERGAPSSPRPAPDPESALRPVR